MLSPLHSVSNVFCFVTDLPAAVAWYSALLGSPPVDIHPQLSVFDVNGTSLTLHVQDEFNRSSGTAGPVAYWDVADVDAVVAWCLTRGGVAHRGPKTVFGGQRLCQVLDPFGNLLGLRQASPR
jgi:predicted enzyme related to lactoylglutathione lyase